MDERSADGQRGVLDWARFRRCGCGWLLMRRSMRQFNGTEPELVSEDGQFTRVTFRIDA